MGRSQGRRPPKPKEVTVDFEQCSQSGPSFGKGGSSSSSAAAARAHDPSATSCRSARATFRDDVARSTHLVAVCLNFMHAGCKPVPLRSLQRSLSPIQTQIYARIQGLVRACARQAGAVPTCSGERACSLLRDQGFEASGYPTSAAGGPEALNPYRNILADQVVLHGRGAWDLASHLGPDLYLPHVEPDCFRFSGTGGPCATFQGESNSFGTPEAFWA